MDKLITSKNLVNLETLENNFISYLDIRSKSADTYKIALKQFFKWTSSKNIFNPVREDVIRYREELKERVKPTTIQSYMIAIRQFFKWTSSLNIYPNICDNVKGVKIDNNHKRDALSIDQAKKLLGDIKNERDYAMILLMLTCGLRTIEVERANIDDIKQVCGKTVLFVQGKGRDEKSEYVILPDKVTYYINKYINNRNDNFIPLFISNSNRTNGERIKTRTIRYLIKMYLRDISIDTERVSAHSLRHTAGTIAIMSGSSIEEVKQMLRHDKIDTTQIYLHNIERINNMSENNVANAILD